MVDFQVMSPKNPWQIIYDAFWPIFWGNEKTSWATLSYQLAVDSPKNPTGHCFFFSFFSQHAFSPSLSKIDQKLAAIKLFIGLFTSFLNDPLCHLLLKLLHCFCVYSVQIWAKSFEKWLKYDYFNFTSLLNAPFGHFS